MKCGATAKCKEINRNVPDELRAKRAHLPPADFLSPKALLEILSFTPTHRAVARVCKEWRFISDNYVPHSEDEIMEKPPTEFLGAEGYELAVGKLPQKDAVRLVCEPGDNPLGVYGAIPDDLVAAVAKVRIKLSKFYTWLPPNALNLVHRVVRSPNFWLVSRHGF